MADTYTGDGAFAPHATDKNTQGYGLPTNCCVGENGPDPAAVTGVSSGRGKAAAQNPAGYRLAGGSTTAGGPRGKSRAQSGAPIPVGYDGP